MTTRYLFSDNLRPQIDRTNRGFFDACSRGALVIQQCETCESFQHPPRAICATCHSFELCWTEVSGDGSVFTYTVAHHPLAALGRADPYNVVSIELDGTAGIRLTSNLIDVPVGELTIGQRVTVVFDEVADGVVVPRFRTATTVTKEDEDAPR